jgi:hypothetical protein
MEAHARIELTVLATLLHAPVQASTGDSPGSQPATQAGDPTDGG